MRFGSILLALITITLTYGIYAGSRSPLALAAETTIVSPDYPWLNDDGTYLQFASYWVKNGAQQYYRLNGRWPDSWHEVVEAGLFDAIMVNLQNQPIDPDATEIKNYGDVRYLPAQGSGDPQLVLAFYNDGMRTKFYAIPRPQTLAEQAADAAQQLNAKGDTQSASQLTQAMASDQVKQQHALSVMLQRGVEMYAVAFNHYPDSIAELLGSGIGPFTPGSINPLTGQPFKGDGSPLDFSYYATPATDDRPAAFYLNHVNADGQDARVYLIFN
jgi:hypothetical protein